MVHMGFMFQVIMLMLLGRDEDALTIVDISTPNSPTHAATISGAGSPNYLDGPWDIYVSGNYAYIVSIYDEALTIFDISTPTSPSHIGAVTGISSYASGLHIFVSGNYAYVTSAADDSLMVFDISGPSNPIQLTTISGAGSPNYLDGAYRVHIDNNYTYIASTNENALTVFKNIIRPISAKR